MRSLLLACAAFSIVAALAQPVNPRAGYASPLPLPVTSGRLITLFVQGGVAQLSEPVHATGFLLPPKLAGVSVTYRPGTDRPAGILDVRTSSSCLGSQLAGSTCDNILAVTAQLPFERLTLRPLCGRLGIPAFILISVNGVTSAEYAVQSAE